MTRAQLQINAHSLNKKGVHGFGLPVTLTRMCGSSRGHRNVSLKVRKDDPFARKPLLSYRQ